MRSIRMERCVYKNGLINWKNIVFTLGTILILNITMKAQNIETGKRLLEMEQWNKANQYFITLVKNNESNAVCQFYLGESFFKLGKLDSAENHFLKASTLDAKQALAMAGEGKIYLHRGDALKAKEFFEKAVKKDKKNTDLYAYISEGCINENDTSLARAYLARGIDISKKNPNLHLIDAQLLLLKGDAGSAANSYERAIYYDKQCARAYTELGQIYYNAKNYHAAVDNMTKALQIDSLYLPALKKLGDTYYWYNKYEDASNLYKKYFRLAEVSKEDNYRFAYILYFNKEYEQAKQIIESLIVSDPQNTVLLRLRGYLSYDLGVDNKGTVINSEYLKNGLQAMNQFFALEHDKAKYMANDYEYWAKLQRKCKCGLDTLAAGNFVQAFQLDTAKFSNLEDAATIYAKAKQPEKAAYCYSLIIKHRPDDALSYYKMGKIYYSIVEKDTARADTLYRKMVCAKADSAFKKVADFFPKIPLGNLMRARTIALFDPTLEAGLARPYYEKTVQIITADTMTETKYKKDLMESYRYLGYYFIVRADSLLKTNPEDSQESKTNSISYWNKLLELTPSDKKAREMLNVAEKIGLKK